VTRVGFFGKLPARGDFVRAGLPRGFVDPWDGWLQRVLPASGAILGDAWEPAWLEAPVWRFALPPDLCGPEPVWGIWMPSVDSVGRYFPLTLARIGGTGSADGGFLSAAEAAGRAAIAQDWTPETLLGALTGWDKTGPDQTPRDEFRWDELRRDELGRDELGRDELGRDQVGRNEIGRHEGRWQTAESDAPGMAPLNEARWWTAGSPRRPAWSLALPGLPDAATFALMLDARASDHRTPAPRLTDEGLDL
jgi:type VI secretion system protein ImpM